MQMHTCGACRRCSVGQVHTLDAVDAQILLARDGATDASLIEISARLGISRNTVHARLKRLRGGGALRPPSTALLPAALGRPLLAFVTVSVSQQDIDQVYAAIAAIASLYS